MLVLSMEIDITLPQQAYAIFESLNYNPWNAVGEFVDNSIQSYLNYKTKLKKLDNNYKLKIDIDIGTDKLEISDNAAGIDAENLKKGLRPSTKPDFSDGLSEFGMGMKTAAFWLCRKWKIISKHFDSQEEFTVEFDNVEIYTKDVRKIIAYPRNVENKEHYTKIILENLATIDLTNEQMVEDLKNNLASMYRHYIRNDEVEIYFNKKKLIFKVYEILNAKSVYGTNPKGIEWKKDIDFTLSSGKRITGFAGLLAVGKPSKAGFTYLRRNRVIEGLVEGVKIRDVLGTANLKKSQRVFAELNLDSFPVSHTKDKIIFGTEIYDFWARLKLALDDGDIRLLYQAENASYSKKKEESEEESEESEEVKQESKSCESSKTSCNPLEINLHDFEDEPIEVSGTLNKYAGEMKQAYESMYKIENLIRVVIMNIESMNGMSFLNEDNYDEPADKNTIRQINNRIKGIRADEEEKGLVSIRGKHDLYYTGFNSLKTIIDLNFEKYFSGFFVYKKHILENLERLYSYRNNIAHNSYLNEEERKYIEIILQSFINQLSGKMDLAK